MNGSLESVMSALGNIIKSVNSGNEENITKTVLSQRNKIKSGVKDLNVDDILGIFTETVKVSTSKPNTNNGEQESDNSKVENNETKQVKESKEELYQDFDINDVIKTLLCCDGKEMFEEELIQMCMNKNNGIETLKQIATKNTKELIKMSKPICDEVAEEIGEEKLPDDAIRKFVIDISNAASNVLKDYIDLSKDDTQNEESEEQDDYGSNEYNLGRL